MAVDFSSYQKLYVASATNCYKIEEDLGLLENQQENIRHHDRLKF